MRSYLPHIMQDIREPFALSAIGTTVFTSTRASDSFRRLVVVPNDTMVVEFQLFWLYDIQHLYDLEHIWVTVQDQTIIHVEASFHGRYLNASKLARVADDQKPVLYCQPGKHAFLPSGELFFLLPDCESCCNEGAGNAGFLVMDLFSDRLRTSTDIDIRVTNHLQRAYAFHPSWKWEEMNVSQVPLMDFADLKEHIVRSITQELDALGCKS